MQPVQPVQPVLKSNQQVEYEKGVHKALRQLAIAAARKDEPVGRMCRTAYDTVVSADTFPTDSNKCIYFAAAYSIAFYILGKFDDDDSERFSRKTERSIDIRIQRALNK